MPRKPYKKKRSLIVQSHELRLEKIVKLIAGIVEGKIILKNPDFVISILEVLIDRLTLAIENDSELILYLPKEEAKTQP